jgi:hypothetical protein
MAMNKHLYAQTLQDEELTEGVTYLHQRDTGLPCDIIVDCGKTYEYYNHPLCLYIVNGNNVYPVDIVKETTSSLEIPSEIIMFIKDNYDSLCAFVNMEIDGPEFFDIIEGKYVEFEPNRKQLISDKRNAYTYNWAENVLKMSLLLQTTENLKII